MYGERTAVTNTDKVVLPVRAALEHAAKVSHHCKMKGRVQKALRRNGGIIFRKQWWNLKTVKRQQMTTWYRKWNEDMIKEVVNAS